MAARGQALGDTDAIKQLTAEVRAKGWILYSARSDAGDWDIFACRPDGLSPRNLSRTPEFNEFSPLLSRDSRRMLYRRIGRSEIIDNNRHGAQGELVLAGADGSHPKVLGKPGELTWASWGPDGTQVATLNIKGVFIYDLATLREVKRLDRRGFFQQVTWSPDGKWLIGVANSFGTGWSVARMEVATGENRAVNRVDCCTPDWFPDSRALIFSWRPNGQRANKGYGWTQLWRVDAEGRERELVYGEEGRHVYGGHVSPDGKYVLFTGNMEEDGDPNHAGGPMALMRLSDGPIIAGESPELRELHKRKKVNHGPVLALPHGWEPYWTDAEVFPASSATGERPGREGWLAFSARSPGGDWDLYRLRPDGSERHPLTTTPDFNEGGVRFSPDGTRLLYYRLPKSEPLDNNTYGLFELVLAKADASAARSLGKRAWACWGPAGELACLSAKTIQVLDPATGATLRELPKHGAVQQLSWSPDGKRFAATANGLGPFWNVAVLDAGSGAIQVVTETERYNCTPDWCPDSARILYARGIIPQQPGRAELWVVNNDGSGRKRLFAEPDFHIYGACASPDGKHIVFTRSREDLGMVPEIRMALIPWPEDGGTPVAVEARELGEGWEPHWTIREIAQ